MGVKRKSGASDSGAKNKKPKEAELPAVDGKKLAMPHVKTFQRWLSGICDLHVSFDRYLAETFKNKDDLLHFLKFVDSEFPEDQSVTYARVNDFSRAGGVFLRPWMLVYSPESGVKGLLEPDTHLQICQLVLTHGFQSDPNQGGVEKLLVSAMRPDMGMKPPHKIAATEISDQYEGYVDAVGSFMVKGWTRSYCAVSIMLCAWQCDEFRQEWPPELKRSLCTIHGAVNVIPGVDDVSQIVLQNRGITMGSIRRKPHALNLLHQMKLLHHMKREDAGGFEAWSKASDVAEAYARGKLESAAAINLFKEVDAPVIDHLSMMVKKHTMAKYVLHDAIAEGCFNRSWCSAGGPMSGWANELTNSPATLSLLCERMQSDYESIRDKSRKAYNFASVEQLQRRCGAFQACLEAFRNKYPSAFTSAEEQTVPPVDLSLIAIFRTPIAKYQKQVDDQRTKAADELAEMMASATFQQIQSKLETDLETMSAYVAAVKDFGERQGALDIRYLQNRYEKGKLWVQNFMEKGQLYIPSSLKNAQAEILTHQRASTDVTVPAVYTILIMDISCWPSRALDIDEATDVAKSMTNGDSKCILFCLFPQQHQAIAKETVTHNRRSLEDKLSGAMEMNEVSVVYADSSHAGDKRKRSQMGVACMSNIHKNHGFAKSKVMYGTLGPVARSRVTDLWSDDPDRPPSPAQRVQQRGPLGCSQLLSGLMDGVEAPDNAVVWVVDLVPNRFIEWGRAVWLLQQKRLSATDSQGLDWKFLSFWNPDDSAKSCEEAKDWMAGAVLTEHWDSSAEAGPKQRPAERFQAELPSLEVLTFNGSVVKLSNSVEESLGPKREALQKKVKLFNEKNQAILNVSGGNAGNPGQNQANASSGTTRGGNPGSRTLCNPVFVPPDDAPTDYLRSVEPATTSPLQEFENTHQLMCGCKATSNGKLKVAIVKDTYEVWLVNESPDAQLDVAAGELFGFNVGSFTERSVGAARTMLNTCIPFLIATDLDLMVHVRPGEEKRPRCLAQLCAHSTQHSGVTELSLLDHDISQKTKDGHAVPFRYTVSPRAMINTFEPRSLANEDARDMRSSMMGAMCAGNFKMLPKSQACGIVWEVSISTGMPSVINAVKPKFWITCQMVIPPSTAVKLE